MKKKNVDASLEVVINYPLFYRDYNDMFWAYSGAYTSKKQCEDAMSQTGEPARVEYLIIKGEELSYSEAPAIYPYYIEDSLT